MAGKKKQKQIRRVGRKLFAWIKIWRGRLYHAKWTATLWELLEWDANEKEFISRAHTYTLQCENCTVLCTNVALLTAFPPFYKHDQTNVSRTKQIFFSSTILCVLFVHSCWKKATKLLLPSDLGRNRGRDESDVCEQLDVNPARGPSRILGLHAESEESESESNVNLKKILKWRVCWVVLSRISTHRQCEWVEKESGIKRREMKQEKFVLQQTKATNKNEWREKDDNNDDNDGGSDDKMAFLSKCGVGHLVTLGLYSSTLTHFFFSCWLFFMLHISLFILSSWQVVHHCKAKRRKEMGTSVRLFMVRSISHGFSLVSLKAEYPDGC